MRIYRSLRLEGRNGAAALAAAFLFFLLPGCGSLNVVSEGGDSSLMLRGNDPVAYFTAGKATPGRPDVKADHRGATYRFLSEENRRQFITSPERYAPQFGGFSAQSMAYAIPVGTDAGTFKIVEGRLYLFESPRARLYFEMDQERNLRQANQYWESEVRDTGSWQLQAMKRQVWRVPGYKSESDLAAEYERRFGRKPGQ
jgi:YHS domain-containing protein